MNTRVLIVDDEVLARRALASLLEPEGDFEVVGECADGRSAIKAIASLRPDLVFLDVQMPGMNGFEVLDAIGQEDLPAVIFVTAYDQFAVRAFDVRALDYLLKPFRGDRFQQALERVRRGHFDGAGRQRGSLQLASDRMVVRSGGRLIFVLFDELEYIRAAANYVILHAAGARYQVRETISAMESSLPQARFVRIHRSYIANLDAIRELYHGGGGEYLVVLRGGRSLPVGPNYPQVIRRALSEAHVPRFGTIGGI